MAVTENRTPEEVIISLWDDDGLRDTRQIHKRLTALGVRYSAGLIYRVLGSRMAKERLKEALQPAMSDRLLVVWDFLKEHGVSAEDLRNLHTRAFAEEEFTRRVGAEVPSMDTRRLLHFLDGGDKLDTHDEDLLDRAFRKK